MQSRLKGWYDALFRPWPPIGDLQELGDFIDAQAAFLTQKGIYEYARARAGHYSKVLFGEQSFRDAIEISRWQAYPLGLAMVCELTEGVVAGARGADRGPQLRRLRSLTLSVFDRYPVPVLLGEGPWGEARVELDRRLQLIGLHPPKRAFEICDPFAKAYFDFMPIHPKLRTAEAPTLHNYLKATLCNMHEELSRRLDAAAIEALVAPLES